MCSNVRFELLYVKKVKTGTFDIIFFSASDLNSLKFLYKSHKNAYQRKFEYRI